MSTGDAQTRRLSLRAMKPGDGALLFPIFNDLRLWWYNPAGRHKCVGQTEDYVERAAERWSKDGLSYWIAFLLEEPTVVVGSGGVQWRGTGNWNLNYRIDPLKHRLGYATELAKAGIAAAHVNDPASPVIAWIDSVNLPSQSTAVKAGLRFVGMGIDGSDQHERAAYADRQL